MNNRNLKVAARLFLAFGTIAVIFGAALGLSIQRLTEFKNEVHGLTDDRVTKLEQTDDWTIRLLETARHTRNMLILDDKEKIQKELDAVQEDKAKRKEYMALLTASAATTEEKAALQVVIDARAAYIPLEDEYLHQVAGGQIKEAKETLDLVNHRLDVIVGLGPASDVFAQQPVVPPRHLRRVKSCH